MSGQVLRLVLAVLGAIAWGQAASAESAPVEPVLPRLTIVVPGLEGGGFDKSAQAVRRAMLREGLVGEVDLVRSPGAGGLIALAQFESRVDGKVPAVFIGGTSILGAAAENHSGISLADLVPICQLNEIALAIAVRDDGPVDSLADLVELMRTGTDRFEWVGGSPGSPDEILLWAIAERLRLPGNRLAYIAAPGGGAQVPQRLLRGHHLAAISSIEEFASFSERRRLKLLAVSSAERVPGIDLPTLREAGLDLALTDWKGVFVSPRMSRENQERISRLFARLLAGKAWSEEQARQGWRGPASRPDTFPALIAADEKRITELLQDAPVNQTADDWLRSLIVRPWRYAILGFALAGLLVVVLARQRRNAARRAIELAKAKAALEDIRHREAATAPGARQGIGRQLVDWGLSSAEIEIAWMILKGLQFKEIAVARGTSERTVRQQAQAIYTKSGLLNRSEFSAYFIEEFCF